MPDATRQQQNGFGRQTERDVNLFAMVIVTVCVLLGSLPALAGNEPSSGDLPNVRSRAASVQVSHLNVLWLDDSPTQDASEATTLTVAEACRQLASRLMTGQGPWGFGVFDSYSCNYRGQILSGDEPPDGAGWTLVVHVRPEHWQLQIVYAVIDPYKEEAEPAKTMVANVIATLDIEATAKSTVALANDELLAATLAGAVLDSMPTAARVRPQEQLMPTQRNTSATVARALNPWQPQSLKAFNLGYVAEEGLWRAQLIGDAKPSRPPRHDWQLSGGSAAVVDQGAIYAQRAEGRGKVTKDLLALFGKRQRQLASWGISDLRDFASKSRLTKTYFGFRAGRELVAGTSDLPPQSIYGLLAEFRGGLFSGFRFYYDVIPSPAANNSIYITYNRMELGYGIRFDFSCPDILGTCDLSLAPRLGIWHMQGRLPIVQPDGSLTAANVGTNRAFAYGYDVAVEAEKSLGIVRLWHASAISSSVAKTILPTKVTSRRVGMDLLIKGPSLNALSKGVSLSFLVFTFYESLTIKGSYLPVATDVPSVRAPVESQSVDVGISSAFGGVGVSTTW